MTRCRDHNCLCTQLRAPSERAATAVEPPQGPPLIGRLMNRMAARRAARRRARAERFRAGELAALLRRLEGPAIFHDDPGRDPVDRIARVGLAICRAGGDHLGDVDSVLADFARLVRLMFPEGGRDA